MGAEQSSIMFSDMGGSNHRVRIAVYNPNSSKEMTQAMQIACDAAFNAKSNSPVVVHQMHAQAPAPASINNDEDIRVAEDVTVQMLSVQKNRDHLMEYDGILYACFSVGKTSSMLTSAYNRPSIGIFEASVLTALSLVEQGEKWGIVTTGKFWEDHLTNGVHQFLGQSEGTNDKFQGVFTSGLDAGDFHKLPKEEVNKKLSDACRRLFQSGNVSVAIMGCAGMVGLEHIIRQAAIEVYGTEKGSSIFIVDAVQAGVGQLYEKVMARRKFRESRR